MLTAVAAVVRVVSLQVQEVVDTAFLQSQVYKQHVHFEP